MFYIMAGLRLYLLYVREWTRRGLRLYIHCFYVLICLFSCFFVEFDLLDKVLHSIFLNYTLNVLLSFSLYHTCNLAEADLFLELSEKIVSAKLIYFSCHAYTLTRRQIAVILVFNEGIFISDNALRRYNNELKFDSPSFFTDVAIMLCAVDIRSNRI